MHVPNYQWMGEGICGINEISLYSFTALSGEEVTIRHCQPRSGYLPDITEPETPFQVHLRCLSLIERVVKRDPSFSPPPEENPSLASIQHFYHIMDRLRPFIYEPWDSIQGLGIRWKHGYYGAFQFWLDQQYAERGWEFLWADPFNVPHLTERLLFHLRSIPTPTSQTREEAPPPQSSFITQIAMGSNCIVPRATLDTLPLELLREITGYLSTSQILRLHRTTRALSDLIPLDQTFWRDQLLLGKLISFLWDLDATACYKRDQSIATENDNQCWDWKSFAKKLCEEPFLESALKNSFALPWQSEGACEYTDFWRELSGSCAEAMKWEHSTLPLGFINRVRIMRIVTEAIALGKGMNSSSD